MFQIIVKIIAAFFVLYGLYFGITGLFAFFKYKKDVPKCDKKNKFAIIIAARNEEKVIGNLIDSLKKQNYDKKDYEIDVIVNNSTDKTFEVAKEHGANSIKCEVPVKSKGEVLRYVFNKFSNKKIDAYIIFDADNVVHPDFLLHMNDSLNCGYKVAQGFRDSKNYKDNWISGSYTLYYYLQNFFLNLSRKKINSSAFINGTGFMVKKDFIESIDFNPITLTEDVELAGLCAINNVKIDFVKDAITYDEQPTLFKVSLKQRLRWSKGNLQCLRYYHKDLIKGFIKNHNLACIDMYLNYAAALVQVLSTLLLFVVIGYNMINFGFEIGTMDIIAFVVSYIGTLIVTIFVALYNNKSVWSMISALLLFTLFMITWIPINFVCFIKKDVKWDHIGHNKSVNIDQIIENEH